MAKLKCLITSHDPIRVPLGFRCRKCNLAGASLGDFFSGETGYVNPLRKLFSRQHQTITRTSSWKDQ